MAYPQSISVALAGAAFSLALFSTGMAASAAADPASRGHGPWAAKPPKVVLISLDRAKPDFIQQYLRAGVLPWNGGLGRLSRDGIVAKQNITATPSLTAVS